MSKMNRCQAPINNGPRQGQLCGKETDNTKYCSKHKRQEIIDKALAENIRYCDISRGCFTILEENQSKCQHCLQKARIRDRKRDNKKRADMSLCLDCGTKLTPENRAKGKKDNDLRRCAKCYEKLQKIESERKPRERNYKAEAFTNKHAIWNHYVKGAKKRDINFTLKKNTFNELILNPCFYCNYIQEGEVNGIDRIDNNKGYTDDNVVTCCQTCNEAKGSQHPQEFIDKMNSIYLFNKENKVIDSVIIEKWKTTYLSKSTPKFTNYAKSANTRNIQFKITEKEFNSLVTNKCYLCGLESSEINRNGIDRFNNDEGYFIENCRPCCGHCNLLKKDISHEKIIIISEKVFHKYNNLTEFFNKFDIKVRQSKVEAREKPNNIIEAEVVEREYKPLKEIIISKNEIPLEINSILQKEIEVKPYKQWKVKQIYEAIQENKENTYKEFCEENNDISKLPNWNIDWASFVLSVKGKSLKDSEKTIRSFLENLRRIRHNTLCVENKNVVERDNRQQWPATTVVRAFLDSKIDGFKKFTEEQTGDKPDNPSWQKRWNEFIKSLEENKDSEETMKELCSKFMTAQRTKRYRRNQKEQ